ncbi:hypothetical protein JXJ21_16505 [candidate division KSB1 bacterium]|nr:hypothetical protein [candidate division KSB1 bacterium]
MNSNTRTIYIPQMSYVAAKAMSAAFKSVGAEAQPSPDSDERTIELGSKYTSGDECYPEIVTLGNFLKVIEDESFDPKRTAFLLPTSFGPCRYGQYRPLLKKILKDKGLTDVAIVAPHSYDGYEGFESHATNLMRTAWRSVIVSDILRKLQLKTRPYECEPGMTDQVFDQGLNQVCEILAEQGISHKQRLGQLRNRLIDIRDRFRAIPAKYAKTKPLIGIVGEIYCRLNDFSNEFLIRRIEEHGGEVWISDIGEWIWYVNDEQERRIASKGKRFSTEMLIAKIKFWIQKYDEHVLYQPFHDDFKGYEEAEKIREIMAHSEPYLPQSGALGEMVSSIGKAIHLYHKGADGVIDISPFTCMNGIVCEAIFPKVSQDHGNMPIRTFYFDGTQTNIDQDVGIFMEMAQNYMQNKKITRVYPDYFRSTDL